MSIKGRRARRGLAGPRRFTETGLPLLLILLAILGSFVLTAPSVRAQLALDIEMRDALTFEPGSFSADPGTNVTLHLVNVGVIPHTFTLFAEPNVPVPLSDNAALQDFYARASTLVDVLLEGGEEATVNFTVPAEEGVYTFACLVPGHAAGGMHGVMFVGVGPPGGDIFGGLGIVQGLLLITLAGVLVFAVVYHVRSTRS